MEKPQEIIGPRPKRGTRYRVQGPKAVNGMSVWNVVDLMTRQSVGPAWTCFSIDEARERLDDVLKGKKIIWYGNTKLTRKRIR